MKEARHDKILLQKILREIAFIEKAMAGISEASFKMDDMRQHAVSMALQTIGEYSKRISEETKDKFQNIPWSFLIRFRNIAAHDYDALDNRLIYTTIAKRLPPLKVQAITVLESLEE